MTRIAYVTGRFLPHGRAQVHVEDRGYQFADSIYEVIAVEQGQLVEEGRHLDRLDRSLNELRIRPPMSRRALGAVIREVIRRNDLASGTIYLQVTRGVAPRDHAFPAKARPQTVITAKRKRALPATVAEEGVRVITLPDTRWSRRDIKSTALLPNVLAKQAAREAGAYEAWLVNQDGTISEGSSTNAWIVSSAGELITHRADNRILNGVTRLGVLDVARELGLKVVERAFSVSEAMAAREAFLTSTTVGVLPVSQIDDHVIANGHAGAMATRLRVAYADTVKT